MVKITLQDGKKMEFKEQINAKSILAQLNLKRIIAVEVNGTLQDLSQPIETDAKVKFLTFNDQGGKHAFWHSAAHIFAHAIKNLYPDAKPTIGPPIDIGFYYDFDELSLTEDDFKKIEDEMKKIIKAKYPFERHVLTLAKAKKLFAKNKYKLEMAKEYAKEGEELIIYQDGDFVDLCEGPHVNHTGVIGAIKLLQISGAYWRGDQSKQQLTRVYGVAFPAKKELREYLYKREEALKRDHVRLGKKLDLFTFSEHVGKGLPLITPKGATIWRELYRFVQDTEIERGYQYTKTPILAKTELYRISGHLEHYREHMFIFTISGEEFALRPMTCPHQYMIYNRKKHSYRDLPVRLAEMADLFRKEQSGELHGMIRMYQFTLADAHIIVRPDQVEEEFEGVIELIQYIMKTLGLTEYWYRFSKWDPKNKKKYVDNPSAWDQSQKKMQKILDKMKLEYVEAEGEAAFYGPKLDIQMRNVHGKEDTMFTVQLDFVAAENFDMTYTNEKDEKVRPLVIHRSSIGCIERTMALLIEKYAGKFPLWMNPEQVRILTVADRFNEFGQSIVDRMKKEGIRAELDSRTETIGKKVREAQLDFVNYICVVGEKEIDKDSVTIRTRSGKIIGMVSVEVFMEKVLKEIKERKINA